MENFKAFEIDKNLRQYKEFGRFLESVGWTVVRMKNDTAVFIRKIGPAAMCKIQRYKREIDFSELEEILRRHRVFRVIIEPEAGIQNYSLYGYMINKEPMLETKTVRVNLRQKEKDLFNSFQKDCRYTLRKFANHKLQITKNDFNNFYEIWKSSGRRLKIWTPPKKEYEALVKCFTDNCFCITINRKAGCLVLMTGHTAWFHCAGATSEGTKENLPYLAVWEAMREAKRRKAKVWDFEGIYDARWPSKSWRGFSHFKKSFGGKEIEYPGSWARWRWPF